MVWVDVGDVRLLTGLTTNDIETEDLIQLISLAQKEVLMQINNRVIREQIQYIDETRENNIDGSNTRYYIANWKGNFISDYNYDLVVNTNDLSVVSVSVDGTESSVPVSSLSYSDGYFDVTTAQNNVDLYVTYAFSYFDPVTPNPLLALATKYLSCAYSYMRINSGQHKQVKFGNVTITNGTGKDSAYSFFYNKYLDTIRELNESAGRGAIWGESKVKI